MVIVTGAAGFIGSVVAGELNQKGYISSKEHRFVIVAVNKKI